MLCNTSTVVRTFHLQNKSVLYLRSEESRYKGPQPMVDPTSLTGKTKRIVVLAKKRYQERRGKEGGRECFGGKIIG